MQSCTRKNLVVLCTAFVAVAAGCTAEKEQDNAQATTPPLSSIHYPTTELPDAPVSGNTPPTDERAGREDADGPKVVGQRVAEPEIQRQSEGRAERFHAKSVPGKVADGAYHAPPAPAMSVAQAQDRVRVPREPLYRERYERPDDHDVIRVSENPVSTFSIDVDTGAYANMRRWLNQGRLPPEDAVRVEEFINYFEYAYAPPADSGQPFAVHTEMAPTPWNARTRLLRIGIQGYEVPTERLPASNLVFLLDVSGSMQSPDKLPLLKQAMGMMVNALDANDRISVVVYAGASGMALQPTPGSNKAAILGALNQLQAGGSTNGAAGIRLAYQLAQQHFIAGGVNRVILATDGDFNVGMASHDELIDLIQRKKEAGIALTTLGFGSGNYNDHLLEQLANEGNGNYAYIDRLSEARKVLTEELSATLMTIAKDVKIQVEFNPATVAEYRLIGYENRILNEEDFDNDRVDAGEIGAGHRVTALYEISLQGDAFRRLPDRRYDGIREPGRGTDTVAPYANEIAHLRLRYKAPGGDVSTLIETPIQRTDMLKRQTQASDDFRFAAAVAAFGQKLRGGEYLEAFDYADIAELAGKARGPDPFGYRSEFLQLVRLADSLVAADQVAHRVSPDGHSE